MSHVQSTLLDGDGRQMVEPYLRMVGTMALSMRRGTCRQLIKMFEEHGVSHHSCGASTLWVIIEHCQSQSIPYTLQASPGVGYTVTKGIIAPLGK